VIMSTAPKFPSGLQDMMNLSGEFNIQGDHMELLGLTHATSHLTFATHLEGGELSCKTADCFVCKRALIQHGAESSTWRKQVEDALRGFDENNSFGGQPITVETLQALSKPSSIPEKKSYYFYDKRFGRKRRFDPWFMSHAATLTSPKDEAEPPAQKIQKRTPARRRSKSAVEPQSASSLQSTPISKESLVVSGILVGQHESLASPEDVSRMEVSMQLKRIREDIANLQHCPPVEEKNMIAQAFQSEIEEVKQKLYTLCKVGDPFVNDLLTEIHNCQLNLLCFMSPTDFML